MAPANTSAVSAIPMACADSGACALEALPIIKRVAPGYKHRSLAEALQGL